MKLVLANRRLGDCKLYRHDVLVAGMNKGFWSLARPQGKLQGEPVRQLQRRLSQER